MYSVVDTSEYESPIPATGPDLRDHRFLEAARRPGTRPTEYWSMREVLGLLEPLGLSVSEALPKAGAR